MVSQTRIRVGDFEWSKSTDPQGRIVDCAKCRHRNPKPLDEFTPSLYLCEHPGVMQVHRATAGIAVNVARSNLGACGPLAEHFGGGRATKPPPKEPHGRELPFA
jgi:hypothetical protein